MAETIKQMSTEQSMHGVHCIQSGKSIIIAPRQIGGNVTNLGMFNM